MTLRTPNRNCLRTKLLAFYAANPNAILSRQEIVDRWRVSLKTIDNAISMMKRDGYIVALFGPNRTVGYARSGTPPSVKRASQPKLMRAWRESTWVPPRPIPRSVWDLGRVA